MKKLIVVALLVVGLTTFAQEKGKQGVFKEITPAQRTEIQVKKMTKELELNERQQKEVKELLNSRNENNSEIIKKSKEIRETAEKATKELKAEMKEKKEIINAKMKAILTDEQYKKWEANKTKIKEKMAVRKDDKGKIDKKDK